MHDNHFSVCGKKKKNEPGCFAVYLFTVCACTVLPRRYCFCNPLPDWKVNPVCACVHASVCLYTYVSRAGWTRLRVSHPSASSHLFFCALSTSTEFSLSLLEMSLNGPVFAIFRRTIDSVHGGVLDSTSISCIYHAHAVQNKQICQPNYPSAFTCIMHQFTPG